MRSISNFYVNSFPEDLFGCKNHEFEILDYENFEFFWWCINNMNTYQTHTHTYTETYFHLFCLRGNVNYELLLYDIKRSLFGNSHTNLLNWHLKFTTTKFISDLSTAWAIRWVWFILSANYCRYSIFNLAQGIFVLTFAFIHRSTNYIC